MMSLAVFASLLFFYSLISQRLERTIVTAPKARPYLRDEARLKFNSGPI